MSLCCCLLTSFFGPRLGHSHLPGMGMGSPGSSNKGLVTNYGKGGGYKTRCGACEVLPLRKGGAEKVLAILKGGHKKFWGSFYAVA